MSDLIDKALLIGMGIEKKARETLEDLTKAGHEESRSRTGAEGEGEGELPPKQAVENMVVDEAVGGLREVVSAARTLREKLEGEFAEGSEKFLGKLHVPTSDDMDVVKEMARKAREKTDELEKRVAELEKKLAGKE